MLEEFDIQKLKEDYPDFFAEIPPDLLEFITSEKFLSDVVQICWDNGIRDDETIEKVVYRVVLALFEQIPKENLAEILEKGAKINPETAEKIHIELNRLIFSQIKEIQPEETQLSQPTASFSPTPKEEKPERPLKKDVYREPIE